MTDERLEALERRLRVLEDEREIAAPLQQRTQPQVCACCELIDGQRRNTGKPGSREQLGREQFPQPIHGLV